MKYKKNDKTTTIWSASHGEAVEYAEYIRL